MSASRIVLFAVMMAAAAAPGGAQPPGPREALDGVDPVALITQGKEVSGKPEFKVTRGRFDYLFATAENKATFEKDPQTYEIQAGGMCARMGGSAMGNPADYAVHNGKIYIFGSDDCHKAFVAAPEKYLEKPAPPMPTAAADVQRGRVLIDRAIAALGGASRLDAISTYVESFSQVQKRPNGDMTIAVTTMWRFPGAVRMDRTMTQSGRTMSSATLVTQDGAWFIGQGRVFPQAAEARPAAEAQFGKQLVALLHDRAGAALAALPAATIDGVRVDRVRVKNGPVDVTVSVDPSSGAVHSLSFAGRANGGEVGEYTIVFDDYREVSGLKLPFVERALFNGAPDETHSRTIETIAINTPLDPALFQPVAK